MRARGREIGALFGAAIATLAIVNAPRAAYADDEVVVRGGRRAPGNSADQSLARAEVRQLPGAFGDPFRAIEVAPGMSPVLTGLPYFFVRGSPPGNVGYYFDGVRVPYLFHFALGPAVVHPALVAKTELYKGGYPAAFGRWAGGIVEATAMPPAERAHGEAQIRLIDAGGIIEAPFANGRGSVMAAGRYSYAALLFSLLSSDTKLDYGDYQTRATFALSDRDTVSMFAFGAYDIATQRERVDPRALGIAVDPREPSAPREIERVLFASEFHRVDLRLDHTTKGGGNLRTALTVGFDRTRAEARRAASDLMSGGRIELVQPLGPNATLRTGADVVVDNYSADALAPNEDDADVVARQAVIFADRLDVTTGLRGDVLLRPTKDIEVVPGLRFDAYRSADASAIAFDPRLSAKFWISDRVRILQALGIASQPPSTPLALPAITISRLQGGLQRSVQTSAGVEADLPEDLTASAFVFHNAFYNLNDTLGTANVELVDIQKTDALLAKSRGSAFGLELGVRRKLSRRLSGLVSYTLSRSNRVADGRAFVSAYDRPHVVNAALSYDLGRSWRVGARFVAYSGLPVASPEPEYPGQVVGAPPARTPAFYRVDARLEKRWRIGERGFLSFVFEVLNATLRNEVTGYRCGTALPGSPSRPPCAERTIGPVTVPSIGIEGGF